MVVDYDHINVITICIELYGYKHDTRDKYNNTIFIWQREEYLCLPCLLYLIMLIAFKPQVPGMLAFNVVKCNTIANNRPLCTQ